MTTANIIQPFLEAAACYPDRLALVQDHTGLTYAELLKRVQRKAAYFKSRGIGPGDRVLVFIPMSIELYETVLALFYMGATAVFMDEWVNRQRLARCCAMARCKGFIAPRKIRWMGISSRSVRQIPIWLKTKKYGSHAIEAATVNPGDTALITFTTGSTGLPKAANRTHVFLRQQFNALLHEIQPLPTDTGMTTLPIVLLLNLGTGCTSVIPRFSSSRPQQTNYDQLAADIQAYNVNRLECSPDFLLRFSKHLLEKELSLPSLLNIFTGGAPVFAEEAQLFMRAFPGAAIQIVYGSTEAEPIALVNARTLSAHSFSHAKGLPAGDIHNGTTLRILPISNEPLHFDSAAALEKASLGPGQVGEIVVSGPHVLSGYIANAEAEKRNKIRCNGTTWHRTGDSGYTDDEGRLFLCGRASMVFEKNGMTFYPFVTEGLLRQQGITGTILLLENQATVIVEGSVAQEKTAAAILDRHRILYDRVFCLPHLPRDKRHFSKIEYNLLPGMAAALNH